MAGPFDVGWQVVRDFMPVFTIIPVGVALAKGPHGF